MEVNDRGTDRAAMKKEKTKENLESKLIHQKKDRKNKFLKKLKKNMWN